MTLTIRRQRAGDADDQTTVRDLTARAFGDTGERVARLVEQLQGSDAFAERLSFVAERDGLPVAHTMITRGWVDAPERLVAVHILSPVSVDPPYQRQGVGRALIAHAIASSASLRAPAIFLEGDPAYYGRLGFERASARGFSRPSVRIPDAAFQVITHAAFEPWMTGALVYPDRFWALDCVGRRGV
jgi:putative acetyltransferase